MAPLAIWAPSTTSPPRPTALPGRCPSPWTPTKAPPPSGCPPLPCPPTPTFPGTPPPFAPPRTRTPTPTPTATVCGLPLSEGFEGGTLGPFGSTGSPGWSVVDTASHTGDLSAFAPDAGTISD